MNRALGMARWLVVLVAASALVGSSVPEPGAAFSYDPAKIDPAFLAEVLAGDKKAEHRVIVRVARHPQDDKDTAESAREILERFGGGNAEAALGIVHAVAGRIRGDKLLKLTRRDEVEYIYKDVPLRVHFDPLLGAPKAATPGILAVGAPAAWSQYGVTGAGVTVAVVDSGISAHPDLAGRVVAGVDLTVPCTTTTTATGTTTTTCNTPTVVAGPVGDPGGHGTHVAGLIAGDGARSGGTYTGVAPNARLVDVRVINANGATNTSTVLRGLNWVLANRSTYQIRVVNLSLGKPITTSYKLDPLATAAEVLSFAGITVVVSAGNSGPGPATITSPANDPFVISVGAVDDAGTAALGDDLIATFSSRGPAPIDLHAKPDVVAPGRKMVSLRSPASALDTLYPVRQITALGATGPDYFLMSGTSMAAPVVAGTVALMLQRDPSLTPKKIKKRLEKTATALVGPTRLDQGAGMVNALAAVASLDPGDEYTPHRVSDTFAKDMRRFIQGQPIVWRSLTYNGGVASNNITWENITWENITWDNITWENITWEAFTWTNITWENITWENITWESAATLSVDALGGSGGWALLD